MNKKTDIHAFFSSYPGKTLPKGEILLYPSEKVEHMYYLTRGFVRMYSLLPDGNELTVTMFKPGSYIPLFLVVDDSKNPYYYEAYTESEVRQAPAGEVLRFLKNDVTILFDATKRISIGLRGLVENLQYQLFGSVRHRIIATMLMLSKRFGQPSQKGITVMLPLTHADIAKFVGVARETISVEMKRLQEEGSIEYSYKQVTVTDSKKLEGEIGLM